MLNCEICKEQSLDISKTNIEEEIFMCCSVCKKQIEDINTANFIGESIKLIIDNMLPEKKKNDLQ